MSLSAFVFIVSAVCLGGFRNISGYYLIGLVYMSISWGGALIIERELVEEGY